MARLQFIGTGEAFDGELGNTSLYLTGPPRVLLDCGYGVPHAFWRFESDPEALDAIYVSHCHADHCFGLPALVVWMRLAGRQRPLRLFGGAGSSEWLREVLELGYPGAYDPAKCFPIEVCEVAPGAPVVFDGVELRTATSLHGVPNHAVRITGPGWSLCYSGDGAPTPETRALYAAATVLVHECFGQRPGTKGHAHLEEVLAVAREARVATLCLVHLERSSAVKEAIAEAVRGVSGHDVSIPRPGALLDL